MTLNHRKEGRGAAIEIVGESLVDGSEKRRKNQTSVRMKRKGENGMCGREKKGPRRGDARGGPAYAAGVDAWRTRKAEDAVRAIPHLITSVFLTLNSKVRTPSKLHIWNIITTTIFC